MRITDAVSWCCCCCCCPCSLPGMERMSKRLCVRDLEIFFAQRYRRPLCLTSLLIVKSEYRHPWINLPFNSIRLEDLYNIVGGSSVMVVLFHHFSPVIAPVCSHALTRSLALFFTHSLRLLFFFPFWFTVIHLLELLVCLLYFYQLYVLQQIYSHSVRQPSEHTYTHVQIGIVLYCWSVSYPSPILFDSGLKAKLIKYLLLLWK